jgi:hypothetical protein
MSLLPARFFARKRKDDSTPEPQPGAEPLAPEIPAPETPVAAPVTLHTPDDRPQDRAFDLVPPEAAAKEPEALPEAAPEPEPEPAPPPPPAIIEPRQPKSRGVHTIGVTDLNRLSIDRDGRLYWDGKPVEVRRRVMMSRAQIVSATVIGAFVVIGAVGAAINGTTAALDWACRIGWTTSYCVQHDAPPPPPPEIPA